MIAASYSCAFLSGTIAMLSATIWIEQINDWRPYAFASVVLAGASLGLS